MKNKEIAQIFNRPGFLLGIKADNVFKKEKKEIDQLNEELKDFRVLFGTDDRTEVEIDSDGKLDYNDKILSEFDIVAASIHSGFKFSECLFRPKSRCKICH